MKKSPLSSSFLKIKRSHSLAICSLNTYSITFSLHNQAAALDTLALRLLRKKRLANFLHKCTRNTIERRIFFHGGDGAANRPPLQSHTKFPPHRKRKAHAFFRPLENKPLREHVFEKRLLVGKHRCRTGKRLVDIRIDPIANYRENLMTKTISRVGIAEITRVVAKRHVFRRRIRSDFRSRNSKERPNDFARSRPHRPKPARARAAKEAKEYRFRLIVPVMRKGNPVGMRLLQDLAEKAKANLPKRGLVSQRAGDMADETFDTVSIACFAHEPFVGIAFLAAQAVIHMSGKERKMFLFPERSKKVKKRHTVAAARDTDNELRPGIPKLMPARNAQDLLGKSTPGNG